MTVYFFKPNEQNAPTVENYLFSKELKLLMNGEYLEHENKIYRVVGQTVAQKKGDNHNCFVYETDQRPIIINLKETDY